MSSVVLMKGPDGQSIGFVAGQMKAKSSASLVDVVVQIENTSAEDGRFRLDDISLRTEQGPVPFGAVGQDHSFLVGKATKAARGAVGASSVTVGPKAKLRLRYVFVVPTGSTRWDLMIQKNAFTDVKDVRLKAADGFFSMLAGSITISREIVAGHFKRAGDVEPGSAIEFVSTVTASSGAVVPSQMGEQGAVSINTSELDEILAGHSRRVAVPSTSMCRNPDGTMLTYLAGKMTIAGSINPIHLTNDDQQGEPAAEYISDFVGRRGDQLPAVGSDCCVLSLKSIAEGK